ncbi:MAG TPA: hypothetical protein VNN72_14090 [Polyangiaceae bacterium]|nr:hypothetical protein [Polyangiaceae bacterium]
MKITSLTVVVLVASASAWACGKNSSDDDDSGGSSGTHSGAGAGTGGSSAGKGGGGGTGGTAGSAQAGTSGTGGGSTGPAITSAPPSWMPPADCGGIGDTCPNGLAGCSTKSTCQLEGYVCIPRLATGATTLPGRTAETPYCAAYTCMTFEEASCFCTGEAGKVTPSCSSPSALAGLCVGKDSSCESKACCDGLTCVETNGGKRCEEPCKSASDCSTGCCTDLYDTGVSICATMTACTTPCKKRGEACNGGDFDTPTDCCRGSCVQSDNPDFGGCRPTCSTSADCDTGCCQLFSDSTNGFCTDAKYCTCPGDGGACGPGLAYCCEGMSCVGKSATEFECRPDCTTDADCTNGKCSPLSDDSGSICLPCANHGAACGSDLQCCGTDRCADTGEGSFSCHTSCTTDADCGGGTCVSLGDSGARACRAP